MRTLRCSGRLSASPNVYTQYAEFSRRRPLRERSGANAKVRQGYRFIPVTSRTVLSEVAILMPSKPPSLAVWFDPQCRANDLGLADAIKAFGRYLESKEIELGGRARSRTVSARRNFNLAVEAICCNLIIARMVSEETTLAVPLAHSMMWARGRYSNPVYGQHFLDVIKLLVRLRLIEQLTKGYRFSAKSKAPSLVRGAGRLAKHLPISNMHWRCIRREPDQELIVERIADVDYQQLYPRLAYARAQAEVPKDDFYDVVGDGSSRDGWKILINAMLFAERPLGNWPENARKCFPEGMKLKEALRLIERKHEPIAHLFGSGLGFQLMRSESDMLIAVVSRLFKIGVPALPLHDAVLVAESQAETAREVMEYELALRTGCRRATVKIEVRPN